MKLKRIISAVIVSVLLVSLSGMAMAADFTDVKSDHKYYDAVQFCQTKNYINGITPTTFEPDKSLTRGQLAVILCRAQLLQGVPLDVTKGSFNDIVPLKHYYDAAAIIMGCLGAIKGTSETTFSPEQNLTREQLAVIIMRTLRLGADNTNAYKSYKDYASIAGWATEGLPQRRRFRGTLRRREFHAADRRHPRRNLQAYLYDLAAVSHHQDRQYDGRHRHGVAEHGQGGQGHHADRNAGGRQTPESRFAEIQQHAGYGQFVRHAQRGRDDQGAV
jgi:hypothetical protein